ncbi:outer membrane protein TolC [Sediminitomix flava]|uniref:Outer membrane protein TolC n=2 Tax=Sediminitomix flava TaxID=379075 RepID=A0A315Z0B1_SEDFL|nr:outer membrane protein TolC [Sediminitomix flava]
MAQEDSTKVFQLEDIYQLVLQNHPVAQQAYLLSENARMNIRMSRGYFDPTVGSDFNNKQFKDTNYYRLWDSYLKVPLWIGELKMGYEKNTGEFLNPESDTNSEKGLAYVGIEIPVLRGLLFDERRAALRKAQAFQAEAEAKQVSTINKLILQIAKDYWNWYFTYHSYRLAEEGFQLARFRYRAVVDQVKQGALAALDTVEAKITIQQREINVQNALVAYQNAGMILSNHLWDEDGNEVEMSNALVPVSVPISELPTSSLEELLLLARQAHPDLRVLDAKYQQLDYERKLNAEMLKPKLTFKYNFLNRTPISSNNYDADFFVENYKAGVSFYIPLFLRKERGKLGMTKVKMSQVQLDQLNLRRTITTNIGQQYNVVENHFRVMGMQSDMVSNYRRLLSGEEQRFQAGESSVFYVNVREGKLLEAETKLFKIRADLAKSLAELRWASGLGVE